jgi:cytochrome c-type protein NapC
MTRKKVFQVGIVSIFFGTIAAMVIGASMLGGFGAVIAHTNTLGFCTSCHEMADNNYAEYKDTIHSRNRTGVRAICSDCHVPHDVVGLLVHKAGALRDLMYHFEGTIDTREKFTAHRLEMAKKVWLHMKETDSRECRSCHDRAAMAPDMQGRTAQKQHQQLDNGSGATCIDCHFGIAHKLPPGGVEPQDVVAQAAGDTAEKKTP